MSTIQAETAIKYDESNKAVDIETDDASFDN